ncbi:magnesium transporter [Aeromicrobium sp. YIM 150415]|uniref:magnesium transporter n=1 Tax=Aeromicrobium sp. YIM 150415 TaxID=2803912 RepID=UPI00196569BE|nr:magnesium transporter [Aeromicrobium sp. YIM 150415]MBM9462492.1 magnesium transporter [Aeromicrobium sp. YIM 150415]
MTPTPEQLSELVDAGDLAAISHALDGIGIAQSLSIVERLPAGYRAVVFRLLDKDAAMAVFEALDPELQAELIGELRDDEVRGLFEELDPEERVEVLDEVPAAVASRLMRGLSGPEQQLTGVVLGYPPRSLGRRMSPELVLLHPADTVRESLRRIRATPIPTDSLAELPLCSPERILLGMVDLGALLRSDLDAPVAELQRRGVALHVHDDAEHAAVQVVDSGAAVTAVVDEEDRVVGVLTLEAAREILAEEADTDAARSGATEPLARPYLATSVVRLARSRVVWLLVLAISAILTVQVLELFEGQLEQVVTLALFIPLLTGTAGNTGAQAATTVTRALALGDVRTRDVRRIFLRESAVGVLMGSLLGTLGFVLAGAVYGFDLGLVIGLTLLSVCTIAAAVGGCMPLVARTLHADPAVFSTPFISTFCDASGLVVYFLIASAVLGI